jgi:hypothetical protein
MDDLSEHLSYTSAVHYADDRLPYLKTQVWWAWPPPLTVKESSVYSFAPFIPLVGPYVLHLRYLPKDSKRNRHLHLPL